MSDRATAFHSEQFPVVERALVGWWDQPGVEIINEYGEWYAVIDDRRFSISAQALAATQAMQGQR